jgi:nucleotide-binding universal stress UspA family protein
MSDPLIVVGVDGSPASIDALRWADRQAVLTGASINAVIGWQEPTRYNNVYYGEERDWPAVADETLTAAVTEAGLTVDCLQTVTEGHPAQVLVAASTNAELLVVGSRGHGGFMGTLLDSVSDHVIAHAGCPVLVVRHPRHQNPPEQEKP